MRSKGRVGEKCRNCFRPRPDLVRLENVFDARRIHFCSKCLGYLAKSQFRPRAAQEIAQLQDTYEEWGFWRGAGVVYALSGSL